MSYYLDTTVVLIAAGPTDHPQKDACSALLTMIAEDRCSAHLSVETLTECLHAATWHQARHLGLEAVRHLSLLFPHPIPITGIVLSGTVQLLQAHPRLGARAALHASAAQTVDCQEIISFDTDFGLIPGFRRWEPAQIVAGQASKAR